MKCQPLSLRVYLEIATLSNNMHLVGPTQIARLNRTISGLSGKPEKENLSRDHGEDRES